MFILTKDWWSTGKARHLASLFAFEFVVIVLGVLTAQAVADWSRDRAAQRDMLSSKERADAQIASLAPISIAYQRVIPRMDERMLRIMRSASGIGSIDPPMLVRPTVRNLPYTELSSENLLRMREHFGADVSDRYERMADYVDRSQTLVNLLANDWQSLNIISPDAGTTGPGDRQEARIIASRMRSTLYSLGKMSQNIRNRAQEIGVTPRLKSNLRLPQDCTDLWRWNSVVYDPEDVRAARDSPKKTA